MTFAWLKNIKIINLNFQNSKDLSDKGLFYISQSLEKLHSLQTLIIDFARCDKITEKGIQSLKEAIKRLKSLKKLHINFHGCTQVADDGLIHLGEGIQSLARLEDLNLNSSGCYHITDYGFGHLLQSFKRPFPIRSVCLVFGFLGRLTYQTAVHIGKGLGSLIQLENLDLRFHKCGYFKDDASETIDRFTEALEKMVSLKRFHHAIEGCTCILDNGLSGLYQTLSHLSLLESIKINCGKSAFILEVQFFKN